MRDDKPSPQTLRRIARAAVKKKPRQKPKPRCEHCGAPGPLDGHHPDYEQPHYLIWLCRPCHVKADALRRLYERAWIKPQTLGPDGSALLPIEALGSTHAMKVFFPQVFYRPPVTTY